MPRDDLSIDFIGNMPLVEQQDAMAVLDEWTNRVANLPNEIAFMYEEIEQKDRQMQECLSIINRNDNILQNWVRKHGGHTANPKEEAIGKTITENYDKAQLLQDEKIALAQKCQLVVDKHTRYLDSHIKALQDRGEFPNDPELPSLLRTPPARQPPRIDTNVAPVPLNQTQNSTVIHARHSNQYPQRPIPAHVQAQQSGTVASSTPVTPAASNLLGRQARESSQGASKRPRTSGTINSHTPSCLARPSSMGPGTPKGTTPALTPRAGSTGPRTQLKTGPRKMAPHGSKQILASRKSKKSGLSRVKRTGNKNSPSSTNESELSDAESGSVEEEDDAATPKILHDGEGDEDMADIDDEDGADDRKYCTCHSISYGDMVACDNPNCEFEWFHWSCVGLKSEPLGVWICSACKASGFKK